MSDEHPLKKSSIFANLLMEKPDNSFAMVKREKTPEKKKKKKKRKGSASLFKNPVWDSFQFLLVQFSVPVSP